MSTETTNYKGYLKIKNDRIKITLFILLIIN